MKTKCLVTGATGYLGTLLVKTLDDRGYSVQSLSLPGDDVQYISPYSSIRYADVCDSSALEREVTGVDIVIHLAGIVDIGTRNRSLMRRVNIDGTVNIMNLCSRHDIKLLYCSSVHAIPCLPDNQVMAEPTEFDPDKVKGQYSKTKAEATRQVFDMANHGLDFMVAFPSGIIGPSERKLTNIGQLIVDFLCGKLKAYIDGWYNFVDVRDVAEGICSMLENWQTGESYILSGHVISVEQMLMSIAEASGREMLRVKLPYWFALSTSYLSELYYWVLGQKPLYTHYSMQTLRSNCMFSNQKARVELGFNSRPSQESLSDMTHWIMEHYL